MTKNDNNRRDQVRLPGRSSSASGFTGEHTRSLPAQARVADVSEGGLRLLVD